MAHEHDHCHDHEHEHEHAHGHTHGHSHGHHHHHHHHAGDSEKNILTAFLLNLIFVVIEFVGGAFTNSIAILSDAVHDLGDCLSIGCAYFFEKLSSKKADGSYTYGYGRFSVISALISAVVLVGGSCVAITVAVGRIIDPEPINAPVMAVIAVFGMLMNGIAALRTHGGEGLNEKTISLHMLEDVLGWTAVFLGSLAIIFFKVELIDPILSVGISVYILIHAVESVIEVMKVLLERLPDGFETEQFRHELSDINGVTEAHHLHIWTINGDDMIATVHLGVNNTLSIRELSHIKHEANEVGERFGISHMTVEFCFECEHAKGESCDGCCHGCVFEK